MHSRLTVSMLLVAVGCLLGGGVGAHGETTDPPVKIRPGTAQLFIDDTLIASQEGLKRTLHQPRKDDGGNVPVIAARKGTTLLAYGTIVRDPRLQRYVMFVQEFPSRAMYRYTSPDGLSWITGDEGKSVPITFSPAVQPAEGSIGHAGIDLFSCYYDEKDPRTPYKGWLYYANCGFGREGIYYVSSADGKTWKRGRLVVNAYAGPGDPSCREIRQDERVVFGPGDVTLFYHDAVEDRFLGIFKFFTTKKVPPGNNLRSRTYAFLDKLDAPFDVRRLKHIELLPPATEVNGDRPFDEYYATTAWRYESLWLGGLKVYHSREDYPHSAAGCAFLKLVVSRDGLHWRKVPFMNDAGVPEVFIPNGREGGHDGRNDGGYISEFSQGPMRIGDELLYYYTASSSGKNHEKGVRLTGGGIFRARLRIDGFVSVDAGTLTTRPITFEGQDLFVNGVGPISVEVLTPGSESTGAATVTGDSLRHRVTFSGQSFRRVATSGIVRLRFSVKGKGRLYSFAIR